MADFFYRTSIRVRAPWLLDAAQLNELDAIVAEQWSRLSDYRERKVEREVDEALPSEIERTYPKPEKKKDKEAVKEALRGQMANRNGNQNKHLEVALLMAGGKKLTADSIKEVIQHAAVPDSEIKVLNLKLKVAEVTADFEIDTDNNAISCRVSPEQLPESRETFAAIRDWIAKHQPAGWQIKWFDLCFWLWMAWLAFAFLSAQIIDSRSSKSTSPYQPQAVEIVKEGVNATNQAKAIELMLALQTGYNPSPPPPKIPKWWVPSVAIGLLACLVFSIKPGSHIGIGKAESTVRLWRKWIQILSVVLPGLIFSSFAWPALSDFIKSWFK